jgi:hypothetical protein
LDRKDQRVILEPLGLRDRKAPQVRRVLLDRKAHRVHKVCLEQFPLEATSS